MTEPANQDPLFEAVKLMIIETRIPHVAHAQIRFKIGYLRTEGMIQAMEGDVVTTKDESGHRKMLSCETAQWKTFLIG